MYEVRALFKMGHYRNRENWEQARMVAYIIAQVNSTKQMKPDDVMQFPWDKDKVTEITMKQEEVDRLSAKAQRMMNILNDKTIEE